MTTCCRVCLLFDGIVNSPFLQLTTEIVVVTMVMVIAVSQTNKYTTKQINKEGEIEE